MWTGEASKIGPKVIDQQRCENLLASYGIEKFQWMTPEDLELANFRLNDSPYFKNVELSLKKSELKNHVHVFAAFVPRPLHHFYVAENAGLARGNSKEGNRQTNDFTFEYANRSLEPFSTLVFGVNDLRSYAKNPYDVAGHQSQDQQIPATDLADLQKKDFRMTDLYVKTGGLVGKSFRNDFDVHLLDYSYAGGSQSYHDLRMRFDADLLYNLDETGLGGGYFFGPSVIMTQRERPRTDGTAADPTKAKDEENVYYTGLVLRQGLDSRQRQNLWVKATYYQGLGAIKDSYFWNLDMTLPFGSLGDGYVQHGLGLSEEKVHNAILPSHLAGLNSYNLTDIYYQLRKELGHGLQDTAFVDLGMEAYGNEGHDKKSFASTAPYVRVGYGFKSDNLAVDLGLVYDSARIN